ncbi:SCL-interrupting locus protein-like [Oopsacas minuta]|uniref:SCL-interrupting locus protein-like n=1 Tax=Oopsacas minuta TaxID=111878 RepID=A0AAV7JBM6_9METZ|nr:SCL-interrupting locus protein-like [Oopsacas minuta]
MVTPLKISFPKTRDHLWDTSNAGEPADIFPLRNDRLKLQFRASTLRLAVQHCQDSRASCCFLLGSAECNPAEDLFISVDRFDPGVTTHSMDIGPTAVLDGDIPVRTSICTEEQEWRGRLPYSDRELDEAIETLSALISQNQQVSLDLFLTLSLSLFSLPHTGDIRLRASTLLSGSSLHLYAIPPIPVLPTALVRNLVGPSPIYLVQQRTRGGYLTMDESRRLLLLLDSDPKAPNFPIVGVWVGGPSSVHHPAVWAACMQYVFTELLHDKAAVPAKGFLLMLYTGGAGPLFFQCSSQDNQLLYSFLSTEVTLSLSQEEITTCDLVSTSCPLSASSLKQSLLSLSSSNQLSFFQQPIPYPPATLAFNREDNLLNLSIIESVASKATIESSNCSDTDHTSFCQQVTSSMLLPQQTPIRDLELSPLRTPAPSCDVAPPLSAEETAVLLRDQQLQIEALQAQVEMLLQHQNTLSPPLPSHCSTVTSLNHTLPSIHPNDVPSMISNDSTRSSALRELAPELLALSPPEPEQTSLFTSQHSNLSEHTALATDHSGRRSRTPGASLISSLYSERDEPVRIFSTEFIRKNETHRELTVRQQTPALDTVSFFSEPLQPLAVPVEPPTVLPEAPILDTPSLSSIYIPRIQYQALPREDSYLSVRDPSDQLTLKYLEGRSILLDPSVQQLSFIQGGVDRIRTNESATGLNSISAMSIDTRAYLERHNLTGDRTV